MANKHVSFSALQEFSENERLELLLSNSLYYSSMSNFVEDFTEVNEVLASADIKNLLRDKRRVYFEVSEYSGAALCSAMASLFTQLNDNIIEEESTCSANRVPYRAVVRPRDSNNAISIFIRNGGGKPKFSINAIFSVGNKNIAYGFRGEEEVGGDVGYEDDHLDLLYGPEKLSKQHVILHSDTVNPAAERIFKDLHYNKVKIKRVQVEAYDKRIQDPALPLCGVEVFGKDRSSLRGQGDIRPGIVFFFL